MKTLDHVHVRQFVVIKKHSHRVAETDQEETHAYTVWLKVDHQSLRVCAEPLDTRAEAEWLAKQLEIALVRLLATPTKP